MYKNHDGSLRCCVLNSHMQVQFTDFKWDTDSSFFLKAVTIVTSEHFIRSQKECSLTPE